LSRGFGANFLKLLKIKKVLLLDRGGGLVVASLGANDLGGYKS
jgi:hypothetical protein